MMLISLQLLLAVLHFAQAQDNVPSSQLRAEHRGFSDCNCMEYWECINRGGEPIAYCGLSESSICCLLPEALLSQEDDSFSKPKCGVKGFDSGHIGVAEPSEWPWHVAIVEEPGFFYVCGGSLVDESWILTAAHCVHTYQNNTSLRLKARLGEYDVASGEESLPHEDRNVSSIVVHPEFNNETLHADLALLRLQSPAARRPHIDVVCIPEPNGKPVDVHQPCFLTGWGKTSPGGEYSNVLKEVFIPVWDDHACQSVLRDEFGLNSTTNQTLCAGSPGKDACHGDGGSPLVCQNDGQWFQHGIVSYGFGCGEKHHPGIYTRVAAFSKWIQSTILSPPGP